MELVMRLIFFYSFISLYTTLSIAADSLTLNQSISDGQTLVSSGQVFELGFFSPGNSNHRYVGIWYKNIPLTVIWVANRENPLTDLSGSLSISNDGNLVLLNSKGSILWSSNSATVAKSSVAQILDTGNLVLRDASSSSSGNYLWQSFDYPTDTLLPGMKLGWDLKIGLNRNLTSWKSSYDPSPGNYSYGVDLRGIPQMVLRMGSQVLYRSGLWSGNEFSGGPVLTANSVFQPIFIADTVEVYYTYETVDPAMFSRLVMGQSGLAQHFIWLERQLQWVVLFTVQTDHCDNYDQCGPFGTCDINMLPNCKCMTGFTPKSPQNWKVFDTFEGCVRTSPLDCGKGDGFVKFTMMKLPDTLNLWVNVSATTKGCEAECLNNCSCTAYAEMDNTGDGKGCLTWRGDLIDIRYSNAGDGQDLYVRLSALELKSIADFRMRRRCLKVIVALAVISLLLVLGVIIGYMIWEKKKKKHEGDMVINNANCITCERGGESELPLFEFAAIAAATNNFSFTNKLGEGGFGPVYKGVLPTGKEIAVKRLSQNSGQGLGEWKNEVFLISKLQHRNLVRLLGYYIQGEERMLIYEYMENRSLDAFIFDKAKSIQLRWKIRYEIIVGIARGLLYLHQDSILRIIHRDLKASNILLDNKMNPKISDFGLARALSSDQTEENTKLVVGTYGYMSPEYAVDGNFSVKSDVFSFGVLVLEIVSGKKNRGFYHSEHDLNLLGHAWKLWDEGKELELLDASMGDQFRVAESLRCIHVGLLCVQQRPEDRPTMASVLIMLDRESAMLPEPKQPGFFMARSLNETDSSSQRRKTGNSIEDTTLLEGR